MRGSVQTNMTLENIFFAFVSYLIEEAIFFALFFFLLKCRFKKKILAYCLMTLGNLAFNLGIKMIITDEVAVRTLTSYFVIGLLVFLGFEDPFWKRFLMVVNILLLITVSEVSALEILKLIHPLDLDKLGQFSGDFRVGVVLVNSIIFLLSIFLIVFWRRIVERRKVKGELLFLLMPIYQLILLIMYYSACQSYTVENAYWGMGLTIMGMIIDLVIIYFINGMEQKMELEEQFSKLYSQRQHELDYYKMTNQHIEDMKIVRHDFRNQIQTVYVMREQNVSKEQMREMLGDIEQWIESVKIQQYCNNAVINAVISVKVAEALERGIDIKINCTTPSHLGEVKEIDLCSLIANLLDNAVEACDKIENKERKIVVNAKCQGGYFLFKVENTYEQKAIKEKGLFRTSKADEENHGYGLKMVESICKKYDGKIEIAAQEKKFTVTTWIRIEGE